MKGKARSSDEVFDGEWRGVVVGWPFNKVKCKNHLPGNGVSAPDPPKRLLSGILLLIIVTCNIFTSSNYPHLYPLPSRFTTVFSIPPLYTTSHVQNTKHTPEHDPRIHPLFAPAPDTTKRLAQDSHARP